MNTHQVSFIEESIRLELNVSRLYMVFCRAFPEDSGLWWSLALEEKHHAALLENGKEYFLKSQLFAKGTEQSSLDQLADINRKIEVLLAAQQETGLLREDAFDLALQLEESAGELHFQEALANEENAEIKRLFARLNRDDKGHAQMIRKYIRVNKIHETVGYEMKTIHLVPKTSVSSFSKDTGMYYSLSHPQDEG